MLIGKNRHLRRRAVIGLLLAASLTLLTLSFRQGSAGVTGAIQRAAQTVTSPVSTVATRVTRPFVDGYHWTTGLINARDENAKLKQELARANAVNIQLQNSKSIASELENELHFTQHSQVAAQYPFVGATVVQQVFNGYNQTITLNEGSSAGIAINDPVVAPAGNSDVFAGLVGRVTSVTANACSVELILDPDTAVQAGIQDTTVKGLAVPNTGDPGILDLQMVQQADLVKLNQVVVTAGLGRNSQNLKALLPPGIPIGQITSVSQSNESAPFKDIQVTPFVDFGSLDKVLVLKVQTP
jgi:rod shape-determining protein MreC